MKQSWIIYPRNLIKSQNFRLKGLFMLSYLLLELFDNICHIMAWCVQISLRIRNISRESNNTDNIIMCSITEWCSKSLKTAQNMVCTSKEQINCLYQPMYHCYKNDHSNNRETALLWNILISSLFIQRIMSFVLQKKRLFNSKFLQAERSEPIKNKM